MKALFFASALAGIAATTGSTAAEEYPVRPITIISPFAAGGALLPLIADGMRAALRQPVIIESVSGAAGTIGTRRAVRSEPDGYTLSYGLWDSHVLSPAVRSL